MHSRPNETKAAAVISFAAVRATFTGRDGWNCSQQFSAQRKREEEQQQQKEVGEEEEERWRGGVGQEEIIKRRLQDPGASRLKQSLLI